MVVRAAAGSTLLEIMPMGWTSRIFRNLARLTGKRYLMYQVHDESLQVPFRNVSRVNISAAVHL